MVTKSKFAKRSKRNWGRRYKKRQPYGAPLSGAPRLTRALRVHQNLTRDCRWFKRVVEVVTLPLSVGKFNYDFMPTDVQFCPDFARWGTCWEEFKVLQFSMKMLPAAVGAESLITNTVTGLNPVFLRGNTVTWLDQGESDPVPPTMSDIIVRPSAKLIPSRAYHKRWATRPRGNPNWGQFEPTGAIATSDDWTDTRIRLYGEGFSVPLPPAVQLRYWYVTLSYKVLFRGRQQFTPP